MAQYPTLPGQVPAPNSKNKNVFPKLGYPFGPLNNKYYNISGSKQGTSMKRNGQIQVVVQGQVEVCLGLAWVL